MKIPFLQASDSEYTTLPELYEKYRLSTWWLHLPRPLRAHTEEEIQEYVDMAIKYHWLVCRYLEEHPLAAGAYLRRERGWWYYDILDRAELEED